MNCYLYNSIEMTDHCLVIIIDELFIPRAPFHNHSPWSTRSNRNPCSWPIYKWNIFLDQEYAIIDGWQIIISGPNHVLNTSTGLYQQSVTLTARMWPPIEAGSPKIIWGLPVVVWSIIIGFVIIIFILASILLCCWLLPRHRKILSPTRDCASTTINIGEYASV